MATVIADRKSRESSILAGIGVMANITAFKAVDGGSNPLARLNRLI